MSILLICGQAVAAEPVEGIRSRNTQPIAPRGGIMLLPLEAQRGADQWPDTLQLVTADGEALPCVVAWMHAVPQPRERTWTDDPRDLAIRAVQPEDDITRINIAAGEGPYLLVEMPLNGNGPLKLEKQTLKPVWVDLPPPPERPLPPDQDAVPGAQLPALDDVLQSRPDQPDPRSPFEYWRWVVRANQHGVSPPLPAGDVIEVLAAMHYAQLWTIGLDWLAQQDAALAGEVRGWLTHTCADRELRFAAWLNDPQRIGALLERLLAGGDADESLVRDIRNWLAAQSPLVIWPVAEFGARISLAAFTMVDEPVTATLRWDGESEGSALARFEPGVLTHVHVDRLPASDGMEMSRHVLIIETGRHALRMEFGPRQVAARPPGVFLAGFKPPLTLANVQTRVIRPVPAPVATLAELRRLSGRWEVFAECRRVIDHNKPRPNAAEGDASQTEVAKTIDVDALRGREAITILLGDGRSTDGQPHIRLTVPETGWQQIAGAANDGTLQVHRRSLDDRWYCRIVLPESWVPMPDHGPALLALIRSHGDSDQLETCPGLSLPWRASTAPIAIDLTHWDDLPTAE